MKKVVGLLAGLCLCAGCENEIPEPTASVVSAGKFVVDYTTAAGAATRVIHENQPKGVRINSLTYLLYSEEGTLEKRREIPGLDTDGESWEASLSCSFSSASFKSGYFAPSAG